MNSTVKSGGMEDLKFWGCFALLCAFVCNEAYFKLHPVSDWEPMEFFSVEG